jgi:Zn-dependent protease
MTVGDRILLVIYLAAALMVGLAIHEYVHAWVAVRRGDQTPRLSGRLTLNPKPHVDPFGSLILPGILLLVILFESNPFVDGLLVFGYAKAQSLNPWALRRQDREIALISMAGPAANILLAFAFGGLFRLSGGTGQLGTLLAAGLVVNVILAAMNLMPIPPLDMSRVVARYLPPRAQQVMSNLEQYGALFMLLIFFIIRGPIFTFVRIIGNGICRITVGSDCLNF